MDDNDSLKIITRGVHEKTLGNLIEKHGDIFNLSFEKVFEWGETLTKILGVKMVYNGEMEYTDGSVRAKYNRVNTKDFIYIKITDDNGQQ